MHENLVIIVRVVLEILADRQTCLSQYSASLPGAEQGREGTSVFPSSVIYTVTMLYL